MHAKSTLIVSRAVAAGAIVVVSLGAAQAAQAAAVVPCSTPALVSAITQARAGATLTLTAKCTYLLTQSLPKLGKSLTLAGRHATLQRSDAAGTPVFTIWTVAAGQLTLGNLNFRNGQGALSVTGTGQLSVTGGTFTGNDAADGGAIYNDNVVEAPTLNGVTFTANSATDSGGAVYSNSIFAAISIINCTFTWNTAVNDGGAIYEYGTGDGTPAISDSTFRKNGAGSGGAILLDDEGGLASGLVVSGNFATGDGGGIYNGSASVTLTGSQVVGNIAPSGGGGIFEPDADSSVVTLTNSPISGNRPDNCVPHGSIKGCTG
jgi:predicted outer membrane repeat protein